MDLELPYPPSVNRCWRRVGTRMVLSKSTRKYRTTVLAILSARGIRPTTSRLAVTIDVYPPDQRRRDLDNVLKILLDALQHGRAYVDDSQIDDLHIKRCECSPGGKVCVRLVAQAESESPRRPNPKKLPPANQAVSRPEAVAKLRACLKCGKLTQSTSPGRRICPTCTQANAELRVTEAQLEQQRGRKRRSGMHFGAAEGDEGSDI